MAPRHGKGKTRGVFPFLLGLKQLNDFGEA